MHRAIKMSLHALLCAAVAVPMLSHAFEWGEQNTSDLTKYYDDSDAHDPYYFSSTDPVLKDFALLRADFSDAQRKARMTHVCARVHAFDGTSGLMTKSINTRIYMISLSKIAHVDYTIAPERYGKDLLYKSLMTLTDGTKIDVVHGYRDDKLVACGLDEHGALMQAPLQVTWYSSTQQMDCTYDASRVNIAESSIVDMDRIFPFMHGTLSGMSLMVGGRPDTKKRDFVTDQAAVSSVLAQCAANYDKRVALQKEVLAQRDAARQAEREARAAAEQRRREQIASEAKVLRANIKVGAQTNCGQVFDVRLPMVGVQTMVGMQYIDVNRLWGPSAGCHFRNGVYVGTTPQG